MEKVQQSERLVSVAAMAVMVVGVVFVTHLILSPHPSLRVLAMPPPE